MLFSLVFLCGLSHAISSCATVNNAGDRRTNKYEVRVGSFNLAFLVDGVNDTQPAQDVWPTPQRAQLHITKVAEQLRRLNADVLCLQEVESCETLGLLNDQLSDMNYRAYLVPGTDTATGQNTALLTRVDPLSPLTRVSSRAAYPIAGTQCGVATASDTAVSKHFFTRIPMVDNITALLVCSHLKSGGDNSSCHQREAQAQVISTIVTANRNANDEVILAGDWNEFNDLWPDYNPYSGKPNPAVSRVFRFVRRYDGGNVDRLNMSARFFQQSDRYTSAIGMIDHILMSSKLYNRVDTKKTYIDHTDTGRTAADRIANGYSDHFPQVVTFASIDTPPVGPLSSALQLGAGWTWTLLAACVCVAMLAGL